MNDATKYAIKFINRILEEFCTTDRAKIIGKIWYGNITAETDDWTILSTFIEQCGLNGCDSTLEGYIRVINKYKEGKEI